MNIIKGLRWLDRMDSKDDITLVYFITHGGHVSRDIFPFDEEDGFDEALVTYWSFDYPRTMLRDDELNFLLSQLDSKGVCLIVDSCHSGGFNDPSYKNNIEKDVYDFKKEKEFSSSAWMEGFTEEIGSQGRVVIMSCQEDELAFSGFTLILQDSLIGCADCNMDDVVSAEETFFYLYPRCYEQHPTICDNYSGELPLTQTIVKLNDITGGKGTCETNYSKKSDSNLYTDISSENSVVCGYITDSLTNEPIERALVELYWYHQGQDNWNNTFTDSSGFYSINVAKGKIILYFRKTGYVMDESEWFNIGEHETLWINISLVSHCPESSIICGYVTDSQNNKPIEDAFLRMVWRDGQRHFYINYSYSNSLGFYRIGISAGEAYLRFYRHGYYRLFYRDKTYRNDIGENETLWINVSLYRSNITVDIIKPLRALYIANKRVIPLPKAIIIGKIDVEVDIDEYWFGIDRVEFYVNNKIRSTQMTEPYNWSWTPKGLITPRQTLKVVAYDKEGNSASDEIKVWRFF